MKTKIFLGIVTLVTLLTVSVMSSSVEIQKSAVSTPVHVIHYGLIASYTTGDNLAGVLYGTEWFAQSFKPTVDATVNKIKLKCCKSISSGNDRCTVGPLIVSIRNSLTGEDVAVGSVDGDSLQTTYCWFSVPINSVGVTEGTTYYVVIRAPEAGGPTQAYVQLCIDSTGDYADGQYWVSIDGGLSWGDNGNPEGDMLFQVWGCY